MRMIKNKISIPILCGLILTGLYSFFEGADWRLFYATDSGYKYLYDKDSLESPGQGIKRVWQKIVKDLGKDETQDLFKVHTEINCKTKYYELLSIVEYDGDREMTISFEDYKSRPPTDELPLESRIGGLYDNICP